MTTHYHEPLTTADAGILSEINERLGALDEAIYNAFFSSGSFVVATLGEDVGDRNAAYLDLTDNKIYLMDSDASGPKAGAIRGFIDGTGFEDGIGTLVISGILDGFTGLTAYQTVYVGTGAGTITQIKPAPTLGGSQIFLAEMGFATAVDSVAIQPKPIQYMLRDAMADDGELTILHPSDAEAYRRLPMAYVVEQEQGASLTSYSSSNQDVGVDLRGPVGAGGTTTPDASGVAALVIGDTGGTDFRVAQSFQITAGQLSQIQLPLVANVGSPTGNITWKVHSDSSGIPGAVLASGTFTPVPSSTNTITVTNGPYLAASTTYWVSFEAPFQASNNYYQGQLNASGAYANGVAKWDSHATVFPNTWAGGGGTNDFRVSITTSALVTKDKLAQGFQIAASSNIAEVELWLKKVGSPTGNLTVKIYSDSGGNPNTLLGTSDAVAASTLGTSYGAISFEFASYVALTLTTQYHIVLETADSASNTNYVVWGADASSPSYSNGVMKSEASSSWSAESKDAVFTVYDEPILHPALIALDYWSSTHADLVNRYGDGAGADVETQTTFKCVLPEGFDDVFLIVEIP